MPSPSNDRRGFLAIVLGGIALVIPAAASLLAFLKPRPRREQGSGQAEEQSGQFIRVASWDEVGATPKAFPVISARVDAWTRSIEPVGAVYLSRTGNGDVSAWNVKCPHEGCPVRFDEGKGQFSCTCHTAQFKLDGSRIDAEKSQSPRDMDQLAVKVDPERQVWVEYKEFSTGTPEKVAKT
jgi:Rieske Fe-S protein